MSQSPTTTDLQIAKNFKLIRTEVLKLKQGDMAALCGISQPMVTHIENGNRELPIHAVKNLYLKKNISPLFILANQGPKEYQKKDDNLITSITDLRTEIEIMKGEIERLKAMVK
jgi:transcriptional regulator with XRE-family HTH domain